MPTTTATTDDKQRASTQMSTALLSDHAEDVLAAAVGHGVNLENDPDSMPKLTVTQVLQEIYENKGELAITLEYGTGQSGVDQATWDIEMTSLQRAFMKRQKRREIELMTKQVTEAIATVRGRVDQGWIEATSQLAKLSALFRAGQVTRAQVDDIHRDIFVTSNYLGYVNSVLEETDKEQLMKAINDLIDGTRQLEVDRAEMMNPGQVNYEQLAEAVFEAKGDIEELSINLERDFSTALLSKSLARAARLTSVMNADLFTQVRSWATSFDLNVRGVLATEKTSANGEISEKSIELLAGLLNEGRTKLAELISIAN